ncbi:SufE family protein [Temperatibacter marinus]|uniref:SufE family protein n=1 Tax=Temperatibacter marinus TaxID=1456591 RepID=A0AA52EJS7_9PROT|nr:SufE family protein [Temperatibacter marinus]WND03326.1 SufE family protein [Temperatibacter marinus]
MTNLGTSIEDILETFEFIEDWEERYGVIIDLGKKLPALDDIYKIEDYRVRGCQSQVWLVPQVTKTDTGKVISFKGDSDAVIVRGLVGLMLVIFNDKSPDEIISTDAKAILKKMDLKEHLSPLRANGLFSMMERIKQIAQSER